MAFIFAVTRPETRLMLGLLLAGLALTLIVMSVAGLDYRFLWQSDEGEFSMMVIGLVASAVVLCSTAAMKPAAADAVIGTGDPAPRGQGLSAFADRVLWSTRPRRATVIALAFFYLAVLVVGLTQSELSATIFDTPLLIELAVAALLGFLATKVEAPLLRSAFATLAALLLVLVMLALGGLGFLLFVIGLHALVAVGGLAASAAAVDAPTDPGQDWFLDPHCPCCGGVGRPRPLWAVHLCPRPFGL